MKLKYKKCFKCGSSFKPDVPQRRMCTDCLKASSTIYARTYRDKKRGPVQPKECVICGKSFVSHWDNQLVCSKTCKAEYRRRRDRKNYVSHAVGPKEIECRYCHNKFTADDPRQHVCDSCKKEKRRKDAQKHRDRMTDEAKCELNSRRRVYAAKRREADRRIKALEYQEKLKKVAFRYGTDGQLNQWEYKDTLGIQRLTMNECMCLDCGCDFFMAKDGSSVKRLLDDRVNAGMSPCPNCGKWPPRSRASSREFEIRKFYPNFTEQGVKPEWMHGMEIDLYDPEAKVGIEFHGLPWHSERFNRNTPFLHGRKADLAERAGIQLIQIFETEWTQRRECVMDKLDAIFHKNMSKIPARKLKLKILKTERDHELANRFLDDNHIQGHSSFQWGVALMSGDDIIAVCTFKFGTGYAAGGHAENTNRYWELNRFATRLHTCVQGGLSRCISAFWKEHPDVYEIFSFADRRWTCPTRSAYSSSGFVEVDRQRPNYMYTNLDPNEPLKNKQFMRKSRIKERSPEIYSDEKTEFQMAHELGYYRIYDAGKIKYRMARPQ